MDLKGKVAFVTGGSGDIGSAIARALATAGADVAISYVGQLDVAAATVDALRAAGRRSLAVQLDQRDPAAIAASVDGVVRELGRVDILVNNRCLAVALAPDVTVNCIAPGLVEGTRMAQRMPEEVAEMERQQAVLGQVASIEDIASQVVLFC